MMHPDTVQTLEKITRGTKPYNNQAELVVILAGLLQLVAVGVIGVLT